MSVWKSREEAYHGSKWGYAVVALAIIIVLSLLGSIFYLVGEGVKTTEIGPGALAAWVAVIIVIVIILIILGWAFSLVYNFFASLWSAIWSLFSNIYVLVFFLIIAVLLFYFVSVTVSGTPQISLANPVVIGVLIALFILLLPFAIFIVDLFSYEHE